VQGARYVDTLRAAALTAGGPERLARLIGVDGARLRRWLAGSGEIPLEVFLRSLDVIADGPYAGERPRIAVLKPRGEEPPAGR